VSAVKEDRSVGAEIEPAEVIDVPSVAALAAEHVGGALVRAAAPVSHVEAAFREYTQLCERLLDSSDVQIIGGKQFRKKSAWRKLAVAFGVSCKIVDRTYERNEAGRIIRAEVLVTATAPNGRTMDGLGACDLFEKCCPPRCPRAQWNKHVCCPPDCTGASHFSNPQHDLPATAATRATNRACADLFGMGEVSAEEMTERSVVDAPPAPPSTSSETAAPRAAPPPAKCVKCGGNTRKKDAQGQPRHEGCVE
jgi:hypothetical protein